MTLMNRLKIIQQIRKKLSNGGYSVGSWMQIPHASIAEVMGRSGYDWVAVDMEHGAISVHQLPDLFRALELGNTLPLVRLAQGESKDCKQALDAGAGGVIVPMIDNMQQLETVRDLVRWPPAGIRGVGFSRANLFGKSFNEYHIEAQQPLLIAMIEHIDAVNNLESILQEEGIDAIMIGPYDLSASMNITAEFDNQKFVKIIKEVLSKADVAEIPCGIHIVIPDNMELKNKIQEGYSFIAYSMDSVFLNYNSDKPIL